MLTSARLDRAARCCAAVVAAIVLSIGTLSADWQKDGDTLAWRVGNDVVWRFSYDLKSGKPFFHPLAPVGGPSITNFKPEDHPWHYALWFSWKYINGANYWEEDRTSGQAVGSTRWMPPAIRTEASGAATIDMHVTYTHPTGRVDLTETRDLAISAPDPNGGYTIEWRSRFVAGPEGAVLDRTPMPGEPRGQVNGGYAGIGVRMASMPYTMSVVTTNGPVATFENNRARPNAPAIACNFALDGKNVGSLAIFSDPANIGEDAPWYLINQDQNPSFRYADPAVLAPAVKQLKAGEEWVLHYRFAIARTAWTVESLNAAYRAWRR